MADYYDAHFEGSQEDMEVERAGAERLTRRDDGEGVAAIIEKGGRMADVQRALYRMRMEPMDNFLHVAEVYYNIVSEVLPLGRWDTFVNMAKSRLGNISMRNPLAAVLGFAMSGSGEPSRALATITERILALPQYDEVRPVDVIRYYRAFEEV